MRSSKLRDKLSFILYEHKTPPRYFEINKGMMRFLFLGLPALSTVLAIAGIIFIAKWNSYRTNELPAEVQEVNRKLVKIEREKKALVLKNEELVARISSSDSEDNSKLGLFKTPAGQKDLTADKYFETTDIKTSVANRKLQVKFNLVNITPGNKKVSGHFIVMMRTESSIQFYPATVLKSVQQKLEFSSGEPFTTSRFRPVSASFNVANGEKLAYFKVFVFSRVGDIIYTDEFKRDL